MKHIMYGDKSLFLGDEGAETLLEYAAVLANEGRADTVDISGIGPDGNTVTLTFLLDAGSSLVAESTNTQGHEPDTTDAVAHMRAKMAEISNPPQARASSAPEAPDDTSFEY